MQELSAQRNNCISNQLVLYSDELSVDGKHSTKYSFIYIERCTAFYHCTAHTQRNVIFAIINDFFYCIRFKTLPIFSLQKKLRVPQPPDVFFQL